MFRGRGRILAAAIIIYAAACPAARAWDQSFEIGAETFYDDYHEQDLDLRRPSGFLSLKGSYTLREEYYFLKIEGRVSKGRGNYTSAASGKLSGMTQREGELRALAGATFRLSPHSSLEPFFGIGDRLYNDDATGLVSSTGALGYDREITQLYVPVGATWHYSGPALRMDTTAEYDQLLRGTVVSRLTQAGRSVDPSNTQRQGYGLRGGVLMGPLNGAWEAGPVVRYWNIGRSNTYTYTDPGGVHTWWEPANTRLQVGLEFLYRFGTSNPAPPEEPVQLSPYTSAR